MESMALPQRAVARGGGKSVGTRLKPQPQPQPKIDGWSNVLSLSECTHLSASRFSSPSYDRWYVNSVRYSGMP